MITKAFLHTKRVDSSKHPRDNSGQFQVSWYQIILYCRNRNEIIPLFFIGQKLSRHISTHQNKIIPPVFTCQKIIPLQEIVPPSSSSMLPPSACRLPSCMSHGGDQESLSWTKLTTQLLHWMAKVEAHLNSTAFKAPAGGGLPSLAQSLHDHCARLQQLQGERLRT